MSRRCRYETAVVVDGIPSELRLQRKVVGKKTGYVDIGEVAPALKVLAGSISCQDRPTARIDYYSIEGEDTLRVCEGRFDGSTFDADSRLSVMVERREEVTRQVLKYGLGELKKGWYPPSCAVAISLDPARGMRSLYELRRAEFSTLPLNDIVDIHERHGQELAATYLICGGEVFRPDPLPFVAVRLRDRVEVIVVTGMDAGGIADAVMLFPVTEMDEAVRYGAELAKRYDRALSVPDHSISLSRRELFHADQGRWHTRLLGNALMAAFREAIKRLGVEEVALRVPTGELELARTLAGALAWDAGDRAVLEHAVDACVEYSHDGGKNPFLPAKAEIADTLVRDWRDRDVDILPTMRGKTQRPGFL